MNLLDVVVEHMLYVKAVNEVLWKEIVPQGWHRLSLEIFC